jgi:putative membrane protein
MTYDTVDSKDLILRDFLAAERTHLANERTLLAYLRSALLLFVTALTLYKLFETDAVMRLTAYILGPFSAAVGIFGIFRFTATRKKLKPFSKNAPPSKQ